MVFLIKKKKVLIYLLVGLILTFLINIFLVNNDEKVGFIDDKTGSIKLEKPSNSLQKAKLDVTIKIEDFASLTDFWQKHFPESSIEADFNSLMSASDFINIYQPLAEQGDLNAKYLVSLMVDTCLAVENEYVTVINSLYHDQNILEPLLNDYQRCQEFLSNLSDKERQDIAKTSIFNDIFDLMLPELSINLDNIASSSLSEERIKFYKQFNSGTEGVLKHPINKETAIFFETISRGKDPISLHAAFYLLSTQGAGEYEPFNRELTAWLLASCASGYGCKNNFSLTGGFAIFCFNRNVECYNKSPEELVTELLPNTNYKEVLNRAWLISQRISNGEQKQLLLELLSTMSPENARTFASLKD